VRKDFRRANLGEIPRIFAISLMLIFFCFRNSLAFSLKNSIKCSLTIRIGRADDLRRPHSTSNLKHQYLTSYQALRRRRINFYSFPEHPSPGLDSFFFKQFLHIANCTSCSFVASHMKPNLTPCFLNFGVE
jgi:hypothetical protein